ncbi:VOC family protein [Streptomyces paludis]|uniref:VOC family protein n=1 Tax=Streptomyces paludis TaxID=2282738 RepID=A0A345HJS3_9ACTN|nr:VOC family protein [Streptomyces paludis]AXG76947.1 VOC family protein [Streptomyces paludis]
MSYVTSNPPTGTPTWTDLDVPDLARAKEFYGALFGWEYAAGSPTAGDADGAGDGDGDNGGGSAPAGPEPYTLCLLRGRPVAGLNPVPDASGPRLWRVYLATDDCDATAKRVTGAGGTLLQPPADIGDRGRSARVLDPSGAEFALWQGRARLGYEIVFEPGSLVRNDLVTPDPAPARAFYPAVFDYTLDGNDDLPGTDFTFLRRPDGHEIGGILGDPAAPAAAWGTLFAVADADAAAERAVAAGGAAGTPHDTFYARMVTLTDPFGTVFEVGDATRAAQS